MAQIRITKLHDGPRNATYHVALAGDGTGDLTDQTVIDPAAFDPPMPSVPALRINLLWYDLTGFDARLEYDYLTSDTPIWSMSGGTANQLDFACFGGLSDRSVELDGSGKIMLTTSGLGSGDFGTIIIAAKKS